MSPTPRALALTIAAVLLAATTGLAAAPEPNPDLALYLEPQTRAVLPDGRTLNLFCKGQGSPLVILESGWGTPAFSWSAIQARFATTTQVCALERAGYGFSDPGPMPRDSAAGVKDLHAALRAAHLRPPYILVGHSLAGFDARLYAYDHPKEVVGLLLLDPPTEDLYRRTREPDEDVDFMHKCAALARSAPLVPGAADGCVDTPDKMRGLPWTPAQKARRVAQQSRASWFETLESEDRAMVNQSADQLAAARHSLGDIPLIVLQADNDCRDPGDAERCAALDRQAHDSTRGRHQIVAGSRHYIYIDRPQAVVAALTEMIAAASPQGATSTASSSTRSSRPLTRPR